MVSSGDERICEGSGCPPAPFVPFGGVLGEVPEPIILVPSLPIAAEVAVVFVVASALAWATMALSWATLTAALSPPPPDDRTC
jgi:hypothetical protein